LQAREGSMLVNDYPPMDKRFLEQAEHQWFLEDAICPWGCQGDARGSIVHEGDFPPGPTWWRIGFRCTGCRRCWTVYVPLQADGGVDIQARAVVLPGWPPDLDGSVPSRVG
jgi:hypothetical protein